MNAMKIDKEIAVPVTITAVSAVLLFFAGIPIKYLVIPLGLPLLLFFALKRYANRDKNGD